MGRKWGLPLIIGVITFVLLGIALWPSEPPKAEIVVAGRDLGAGTVISPADLKRVTVEEDQAPSDAVTDPSTLAGKTLSVVRFRGEPVTLRHTGPAVTLQPNERAIGVRVRADTAVGRLISPGAKVGVVATLEQDREDGSGSTVYSKALLEDLRVLYVPPDFQARPYQPAGAPASATFGSGSDEEGEEESGGSSLLASQSSSGGGGQAQADEGVIVLAVSTDPQKVTYESAEAIAERQAISTTDTLTDTLASVPGEDEAQTQSASPAGEDDEPEERYVVPVELLAGLNANDASFTLVMMPEKSEQYTSSGLTLDEVVVGVDNELQGVAQR